MASPLLTEAVFFIAYVDSNISNAKVVKNLLIPKGPRGHKVSLHFFKAFGDSIDVLDLKFVNKKAVDIQIGYKYTQCDKLMKM
jgi:hypothetical protein